MKDKLLEQVSALADDELDAREAELLLSRMQRDSGLRDAWGRYHLIGEAVRHSLPRVHETGFAERIAAAIEQEDNVDRPRHSVSRLLVQLRPVAGMAVAASVAMLAVFTLQGPPGSGPSEVVPGAGNMPMTVPVIAPRRVDFTGVRSPELQDQLRSYLLDHSEHSGSSRVRGGVMPYVQIAAQDTRPADSVEEDPESQADGKKK
ncbi:MAG: sigma-E factor negative regulatory protein [Proteobacteria bacterium]|nr:sigma-E factor negative regulatory protein [Pseudomonadota bacterium]